MGAEKFLKSPLVLQQLHKALFGSKFPSHIAGGPEADVSALESAFEGVLDSLQHAIHVEPFLVREMVQHSDERMRLPSCNSDSTSSPAAESSERTLDTNGGHESAQRDLRQRSI